MCEFERVREREKGQSVCERGRRIGEIEVEKEGGGASVRIRSDSDLRSE